MKIIWTIGGKVIPTIGMAIEGKTAIVPKEMGEALIKQGLARNPKEKPEKKREISDFSKDELIHACIEKGIDPPDNANKSDLIKLLEGK